MKYSIFFKIQKRTIVLQKVWKTVFSLSLFCSIFFIACKNEEEEITQKATIQAEEISKPMKVIFETDMGNDIDDALALDMLYKYQDQGKIDLLAISSNKNSEFSPRYIDIMNTWYGYSDIPIGKVVDGAESENDAHNYAKSTWNHTEEGKPVFRGSIENYDDIPEATELYRKVLAEQPDSSVTLISVGFSTNLARLLETSADQYSDLSGKELVAKKVKLLSIMAGSFQEERLKEYNVIKDVDAARKVFEQWPTEIVASPFEVGIQIEYPGKSIQEDFSWAPSHPMVVGYENYLQMPYDRPTWDLTSVLYVVEGPENYFELSPKGKITVENDGKTYFEETSDGNHRYLKVTPEQVEVVKERFVELITREPEKRN